MSHDTHIMHFDREGGGKNGDAIFLNALKGLMFRRFTLEQDTFGWVTAKNECLVKACKSGCHMLV
jgi:hypothetical protein